MKYNAASRVFALLSQAREYQHPISNTPAMLAQDVWAALLRVEADDESRRHIEVARLLTLAREQLGMARDTVRGHFPDALVDGAYSELVRIFDLRHLYNQWSGTHNLINPNVLKDLQYWVAFVPADAAPVDDDTFQQILAFIAEIENELLTRTLPDHARAFLLGQIELVKRAIREYFVVGPDAYTKAYQAAIGQVMAYGTLHEREFKKSSVLRTMVKKVGGFWVQLARVVEALEKVAKLGTSVMKLLAAANGAPDVAAEE